MVISFNQSVVVFAYIMLMWSWQFLLLLTVTWLGVKLDRSRTAAARYRLWLAGLAACVLLPFWGAIVGMIPPTSPVAAPVGFVTQITRPEVGLVLPEDTPPVVVADIRRIPAAKPLWDPIRLWRLAVGLWAAGCAFCFARLGFSYWKTRSLRKRARLDGDRLHARVRLGYSGEIAGPMLVGLWHPMILLPEGIENWTTEPQRTAIIRHELAHWVRRDPVVHLLQGIFGAVFFFHPMVRFALRQLSLERELACDDRVLEKGTDAAVYAEAILQTAEKGLLRRERLSALHASRWILERRMKMILAERRPRPKRFWCMASAAAVVVLLVAVSALTAVRAMPISFAGLSSQDMSHFGIPNLPPSYDLHIKATPPGGPPDSESNTGPGFWSRHESKLRDVLAEIYGVAPSHIDLPVSMDGNKRYDLDLVLPQDVNRETVHRLVQRGIEKELHVRMSLESRNMDVYVLTALDSVAAHELAVSNFGFGNSVSSMEIGPVFSLADMERTEESRLRTLASGTRGTARRMQSVSSSTGIADFARMLESFLDLLVLDETQLDGNYDLKFSTTARSSNATIADQLRDQLGLVLTPAKRGVQILAVREVDASSTIPLTDVGPLGVSSTAPRMPAPPPAKPTQVRLEDVRAIGLDVDGVSLVSPSSPDFDARMEVAAPGWAHLVQPFKPYLVLVSNRTKRKVVAYALQWTMTGANGRSTSGPTQFVTDPDAIAGDFNSGISDAFAIPSGKDRLAASDFRVSKYKPILDEDETMIMWIQTILQNYDNVRKVEVRLVTVIFDDGSLIGQDSPDQSSLASQFALHVKTKQDLYRTLAERIGKGNTVDEAFQAMRKTMPQDLNSVAFGDPYPSMALSEAEELRKEFGDARFRDILRQAILKNPFLVRRQ